MTLCKKFLRFLTLTGTQYIANTAMIQGISLSHRSMGDHKLQFVLSDFTTTTIALATPTATRDRAMLGIIFHVCT